MNRLKVFLSGGMANLSMEEQQGWREYVNDNLEDDFDVFDPTINFNYNKPYDNERQVMNYDLWHLRHSDIVIVNFNCPSSIGSACELMLAYELRKPIIGLNVHHNEVYSWLLEFCDVVFDDIDDLTFYVREKYIEE